MFKDLVHFASKFDVEIYREKHFLITKTASLTVKTADQVCRLVTSLRKPTNIYITNMTLILYWAPPPLK